MKILSHNVRVWTRDRDKNSEWYWKDRMESIKAIIEKESPDVLCFQELSFPATRYIPKGYRRVGITASHPIYVKKGIKIRKHCMHFRWDKCEVLINGGWMVVVNVHLHWDDKIFHRNMEKINKVILKAHEQKMINVVCGDFNKDRASVLKEIAKIDWVVCNDKPTFQNQTTGATGIIDHFALNGFVRYFRVIEPQEVLSDHKPIVLEI